MGKEQGSDVNRVILPLIKMQIVKMKMTAVPPKTGAGARGDVNRVERLICLRSLRKILKEDVVAPETLSEERELLPGKRDKETFQVIRDAVAAFLMKEREINPNLGMSLLARN